MTILIGLTGLAGSGKDTACEEIRTIVEEVTNMESFAFADPLKEGASVLFGVDVEHFYRNKQSLDPLWGITYREMLQKLGTEFARDLINTDFWTIRATATYRKLLESSVDIIVCTDVRFDNEARWIESNNGVVIEIVREQEMLTQDEQNHASEAGVLSDYVQHTIDNNSSIENLNGSLRVLLRSLGVAV